MICATAAVTRLFAGTPVMAAADSARFDIPGQPMPAALKAFAKQAHMQLFYVYGAVVKARANAVSGELDKRTALSVLLRDSGLEAVYASDTEATIRPIAASAAQAQSPGDNQSQHGKRQAKDPSRAGIAERPTAAAQFEEIIVTSQKRAEPVQDVPVPVTVITASRLADGNRFRIQDYYQQVPGLSLTPNEFDGAPTIAIRGIISGDFTNPTVGVTVDDVPIGPSTVIGGGYFTPDLDPSDLARIEVLRGPQGTLYGASSMGGLLKYVTVDPSLQSFTGRIQAGLSGVHYGEQTGYNISAAMNVPLGDALAMRASGFMRQAPGYIDNARDGERGVNETQVVGSHLSAMWRPSAQFSLKLSALFQNNKLLGSPYVTVVQGLGALQQDFLPRTGGVERKFETFSATAIGQFAGFDLTYVAGYSISHLHDSLDYTQILGSLTSRAFATANTINTDNTHTNKLTQELRLSRPMGARFDWLIGGFYTHEYSPFAIEYIPTTDTSQPLGSFGKFNFSSVYAEGAAFTDLIWHVTDTFDIQVGGRESRIRQRFEEVDYGIYVPLIEGRSSPAVTPKATVHENALTYLLTPRLRLTPDIMVYVRLASGFRPGGINQGDLAALPADFAPDRTENYEIGVKGDVPGHRISFEGSVYQIDWKNMQLSLINQDNGQNYFSNGGEARSRGVELSVQAMPVAGLHLGSWVSWNEAVLTKNLPVNSTTSGMAGDRLPYSSRFSGSVSLDYSFPLGAALNGSFGGSVSYVGNRIGAFHQSPRRQELPAYAEVDLHAAAHSKVWTFELYVNNVMDRRGVMGGGIGTAIPTSFGLIQPRTAALSVSRIF